LDTLGNGALYREREGVQQSNPGGGTNRRGESSRGNGRSRGGGRGGRGGHSGSALGRPEYVLIPLMISYNKTER
jgi:hypothetical protein